MTVQACAPSYSGADRQVTWVGVALTDGAMADLGAGPLQERALDEAYATMVLDELRAIDSTDMSNEALVEFLGVQVDPLPWQIGEALAEVLLEEWHGAVWLWNSARDLKTGKASLPGADLVGFVREAGVVRFLFGEVKSSSDGNSPPGVLHGRTGLIDQLERLCSNVDHFTLIKWLRARCTTDEHLELFRLATLEYFRDRLHGLHLVGCLLRDTAVTESDIKPRAKALADIVTTPRTASLHVWYLPVALDSLPGLIKDTA